MANPFEDLGANPTKNPSVSATTTKAARLFILGTVGLGAVLLLSCCGVVVGYQLIMGGPFIGAIGSRPITEKEFDRVRGGMTKKEVTDILGPPARTGSRSGRLIWYWYEKDGRAGFSMDFDDADRVRDMGVDTPD
jgi:outer membrane protein assembly factor BamE (lipoprotein component of BamABCDE complex)